METWTKHVLNTFLDLVRISGESRHEKPVATFCENQLKTMGLDVWYDDAGQQFGGDCGNLYARLSGNLPGVPPLLLNAHLDTVSPGRNICPVITGDVIRSDGTTVLGADNRAGVAAILCGLEKIISSGMSHGPIEILLTVGEEAGLLGARYVDFSQLSARWGFALDSSGLGNIVIGAPFYNAIDVMIHGRAAHAAVEPENGISAIGIAVRALLKCPHGRIDDYTTANAGVIQGGTARNIVPDICRISMEIRSHSRETLERLTRETEKIFRVEAKHDAETLLSEDPVICQIHRECDGFSLPADDPAVECAKRALMNINQTPILKINMGASDANIFNSKGVATVILGTGQTDVHSLRESIKITDLLAGTELVPSLIAAWPDAHQ